MNKISGKLELQLVVSDPSTGRYVTINDVADAATIYVLFKKVGRGIEQLFGVHGPIKVCVTESGPLKYAKINSIRFLRNVCNGLSLKDAKETIESAIDALDIVKSDPTMTIPRKTSVGIFVCDTMHSLVEALKFTQFFQTNVGFDTQLVNLGKLEFVPLTKEELENCTLPRCTRT